MALKDEINKRQIYTNDDYSLYERFKDILTDLKGDSLCLYSLVGYFRSSGYIPLASSLKGVKKIKIVVGINADALSANWYKLAKGKRDAMVRKMAYRDICLDIEGRDYIRSISDGLKSFVEDVLSGRLEMRAIAKRTAHAKFYVFADESWRPGSSKATLITGSSNFTGPGLGIAEDEERRNYELNIESKNPDQIDFVLAEFNRLWEESVELIPTEIESAVKAKASIGKAILPEDFYYRFLYEVFKDTVDFEGNGIEALFPTGIKRLSYQIDAVNEGLGILERHNGLFLADVVGLGKTVVTTILLMRYFATRDKQARALIVAPPVLVDNWRSTLDAFQIPHKKYSIISSGSLHKVNDPGSYAIIVVDEAHNFRNSGTEAYRKLEELCKLEGDLGRKNVILVSATPLNNRPTEILNLLALFQETRDSSLGVSDLAAFFQDKQRRFDEAKKIGVDPDRARAEVKEIYKDIRELVVQDVTIRRTRSDLMENESYRRDLLAQSVSFPVVQKPRSVPYYLDNEVDELFDETLVIFASKLKYAYHKQLSYLASPARDRFAFTENSFIQLSGLLVRFFLKRLDSSFHAFRESLGRFSRDTKALRRMLAEGKVYYSNSIDVSSFVANEDVESLLLELESKRSSDPSISEFRPEEFNADFSSDLESDDIILSSLLERWEKIEDDPKFAMFASQIENWLKESVNPGRKIVIFSESEDSVDMIRKGLEAAGRTDVLAVSSANRDERELSIRMNFDANLQSQLKEDRFRILVTTDVLSEGVNLHRANTIVNYDTPWNSVRMFQRVGRVNRVGGVADKVYIYNFFPLPRVDDIIELKKKAEMKLQAFHSAFGEDAAIYSPFEEVEHFGLYGGEGAYDEGSSPKVKLLLDLRSLMENDPDRFDRITRLPKGLRCLRRGSGSSLVYLATARRDIFLADEGEGPSPLGLIEAASRLRAESDEAAMPGEYPWAESIARAQEAYSHEEEEKAEDQSRAKSYSPRDARAISYLDYYANALGDNSEAADARRELFVKAARAIRSGAATKKLVEAINESVKNASHMSDDTVALHLASILGASGLASLPTVERRPSRDLRSSIEPAHFIMAEAWRKE